MSGFEADPFARGIPNGLAYALGLEPRTATPAMLPRGIDDDGRFALMFTRPAELDGVSYQVEASTTLGPPWEVLAPEAFTIVPHPDGTETVIARDPFEPGENSSLFLRLKVVPDQSSSSRRMRD